MLDELADLDYVLIEERLGFLQLCDAFRISVMFHHVSSNMGSEQARLRVIIQYYAQYFSGPGFVPLCHFWCPGKDWLFRAPEKLQPQR